jgi:hypothetical protein
MQIVVTVRSDGTKSEYCVLSQNRQNSYWNFPAHKTVLRWHCSLLYTGFKWYARFQDGCENLEDDEHSEQPITVRKPEMIEAVREFISTDRRMTLRMMEEELEIRRETIRKISEQEDRR